MTKNEVQERNERMYAYYWQEMWSLQEVADEFDLHVGTVGRIFQRNNWPRRPPGKNTKYLSPPPESTVER